MKDWIEQLIIAHPKLAVTLVAFVVALIEALTGVTVSVGNEAIGAVE